MKYNYRVTTKNGTFSYKTGDCFVKKGKSFNQIRGGVILRSIPEREFRQEWYSSKDMTTTYNDPTTYEVQETFTEEEKKDITILDKFLPIDSDLSFLGENEKGELCKILIPLASFEEFFEVENIELDVEVDYQSPAQHIFDEWINDPISHDIEITLLTNTTK